MNSSPAVVDDVAYEAARHGVAIGCRTWRSVADVGGDDRQKFLQGMLSNDVELLTTGAGCPALLLDVKGHVIAHFDVWADADALVLGGESECLAAVLPRLQRYVLASAVTLQDRRADTEVLGVVGPAADELLRDAAIDLPEACAGAHVSCTIDGVELRVARVFSPSCALELHVPSESVDRLLQMLGDASRKAPAELDAVTSEVLRVEAGEPRYGAEITGEEFPQEAGLDQAVNYDKGCYLGQETVARIHYRGQVNRLLQGFTLDGDVASGTTLTHAGKSAGNLTSIVDSPRFGVIGLGYVRRDLAASGAALDVVQDDTTVGSATVVTLPFHD